MNARFYLSQDVKIPFYLWFSHKKVKVSPLISKSDLIMDVSAQDYKMYPWIKIAHLIH